MFHEARQHALKTKYIEAAVDSFHEVQVFHNSKSLMIGKGHIFGRKIRKSSSQCSVIIKHKSCKADFFLSINSNRIFISSSVGAVVNQYFGIADHKPLKC